MTRPPSHREGERQVGRVPSLEGSGLTAESGSLLRKQKPETHLTPSTKQVRMGDNIMC